VSGQQDNENKYNSWIGFCTSSPTPIAYSIAVLDLTALDQFGKALSQITISSIAAILGGWHYLQVSSSER
jgi:hypothetical protein